MIALIEYVLLALTDTQFDKILALVTEILLSFKQAIEAIWAIASPLLLGLVALQLARYQQAAKEARKTIVEKIDDTTAKAQKDRSKIIEDIAQNTEISEKAFETANNHNAKIAAVVEYVKPKIPPMP